jgi:hypothetical protein
MTANTFELSRSAAAPAVGSATREFFAATGNLFSALHASLFKTAAPRALTVFEEAEQVRMLAESYADTDRGFAADLFAAADRHELQNRA